jgi:hypothetical protein
MPSFKHILFPVDFSPRCEAAVAAVKDMRHELIGAVTLITSTE